MSKTREYNVWAVLLAALVLVLPVFAWQAFVLASMWGWFVTSTFGVPVPNLWAMAGLMLLLRLLAGGFKGGNDKGTTTERIADMVGTGFVVPAVALGIAWVIAILAGTA